MDLDELFPDKPDDPLTLLTKQDLDPLSVEELEARIAILEGEIARVQRESTPPLTFGQAPTSYSRNDESRVTFGFPPAFVRGPA